MQSLEERRQSGKSAKGVKRELAPGLSGFD